MAGRFGLRWPATAAVMFPIGPGSRLWLNRSTKSSVASSTSGSVFQVWRRITCAFE
jgi:hypothetical protein